MTRAALQGSHELVGIHAVARWGEGAVRARLACLALLASLVLLGACAGPGRVQYDGGRCLKDGRTLTAQEVEDEEADVARRIASRQPWFAVITIGVVLVAAATNAERARLVFRARHTVDHRPLTERLREILARQRENPVLFATIVGASLFLVAIGGGFYVFLDIDKRASERALGMLQFCHIALRAEKEQAVLDKQRQNLQAIESTATDIRTLVGKLPPDEQRKAQLIVGQMNDALAKQGRIVGDYLARTDEAEKDLSTQTAAMEKGLASVQGDLAELRSLPTDLKDLEGATRRIDQATTSIDGRFDDLRDRVARVEAKMDALVARPVCSAPVILAAPIPVTSAAHAADARAPETSAPDGGGSSHAPP